ncbi:hypothetical protein GSI_13278 [Ganoderma sinense ZZ0214-1]|uniref:F-box domain-containing protein n=1 Tax=Ganoderma sinense ZZ0214-1 TaxID=1077348 RepID=A0A2G8RVN3_9APHY|nr:hypothetical protein GSI_13278 [Ganoderma sinense ZZ0214-1]
MPVPDLNEDILTVVCDFLSDVSDVLAVSLTCSRFRPIAIRRLLAIRLVLLNGDASIRRFHAFLFADAPARAPLIRALDIQYGSFHHPLQAGDATLFMEIVTMCHRLEHVTFGLPSSAMLAGHPNVIDAIASIPNLRSLSISSTAEDALALVRNVRAPLRHLGLWCFYGDPEDEFNWYPAAFQDTLAHLEPSLEELGFHQLIVDPEKIRELRDSEDPGPLFSSWTQYPAVRSLSVNCFSGRLLLDPLQRLFPALDGRLSVGQVAVDNPEDTLADIRASNQLAQGNRDKNASGDGSRSYAWRKLDSVVSSPVAFYLLGLRCPIRFVTLDAADEYYGPEAVQRCIAESLRESPVPHLALCLVLHDGLAMLSGLPPPEVGGTLTHLTLALDAACHWAPQAPFGWNELLDEIQSSLRPLRELTHLRIVFQSKSPADREPDTDASVPPSLGERLARTLHPSTFDFQVIAVSLVRQLPSLRSLFLTTCGYFTRREHVGAVPVATNELWCVSRAWNVAPSNTGADGRQGGERMLVELRDEDAEAIIQREELILPDSYKLWFTHTVD